MPGSRRGHENEELAEELKLNPSDLFRIILPTKVFNV